MEGMISEFNSELSIKSKEYDLLSSQLAESVRLLEEKNRALDECKLNIFENDQDSRRGEEDTLNYKLLRDEHAKLENSREEILKFDQSFKRDISEKYLTKSNFVNDQEIQSNVAALTQKIATCQSELDNKSSVLLLAKSKEQHLESQLKGKEKNLAELMRVFDDMKETHRREVRIIEEYISCLKNTIQTYEKCAAHTET